MAPPGDDSEFSVDIDELEKGGVRIKDMANIISVIRGNLEAVGPVSGFDGDGDVEKSLRQNYVKSATASLGFFQDLADLVDTKGDKVLNLTAYVGSVNDAASVEAGSRGRKH